MSGGGHGLAHRTNIAEHTGCSFIVGDENRLDVVAGVGCQTFAEFFRGRPLAPGAFDDLDVEIVFPAEVDPAMGEHAVAGDQHLVAWRQGIGYGSFPAAGAAGRVNQDFAGLGLEHFLQVAQKGLNQSGHIGSAMVRGLNIHRGPQSVRDIGGPRDKNRVLTSHCRNTPCISLADTIRLPMWFAIFLTYVSILSI